MHEANKHNIEFQKDIIKSTIVYKAMCKKGHVKN